MRRLSLLVLVSFLTLALTGEGRGAPSSKKNPPPQSSPAEEVPYVPGKILVQFKSEVAEGIATGNFSLNSLTSQHRVRKIKPLFKTHHEGIYKDRQTSLDFYNGMKDKFPERSKRISQETSPSPLQDYFIFELEEGVDVKRVVSEFRNDPSVLGAWPDYIATEEFVPNDPYYSSIGSWGQSYDDMWAVKRMDPEPAWDLAQGNGVVVAVVDSGLDYDHEDIKDGTTNNVWTNPGETPGDSIDNDNNGYVDDIRGFDFANSDPDPMDDRGHGTHVSGTIAAIGNNAKGIIGVAYKSKIMPLKALDQNGSGSTSGLAEALYYAANKGADVINNSWGYSTKLPNNPPIEEAIRYAHSLGCVVVFAAGNTPADDVMYYSPKNMPEVITVASSDYNDKKSDFSKFGSRIDVIAPGGGPTDNPESVFESRRNILSLKTGSPGAPIDNRLAVGAGQKYYRNSGTSMAAPHVSGLAALLLSYRPTLTNEEVRHLIRSTADDLTTPCAAGDTSCTGTNLVGFDLYTGYGRINAKKALQSPTGATAVATITSPRYQNVGKTFDIKGTATANPFVSSTLLYARGIHPPLGDPSWNALATLTAPVPAGTLYANFDTSALEKGDYTLSLLATGVGVTARDNILFNIPWPFKSYGQVRSSSAVADLEGDGTLEVLIGSDDGKLYCLNADGGERWSYPTGGAVESSPAIADLDGNGTLEILFGSKDYGFYCLNADGSLRWSYLTGSQITSSPAIADLDGNGTLEILFGSYDNKLYCLNADGSLRWSYLTGSQITSSPAIADLDGNGTLEIL
ncbi:MAG: S8 family serine peptidase, partial [Candidatus Omnitrophica bacterium]|nr:S8 family serine peptidase [Candidatus Omnitrophota bacterium]